MDLDALAAFLKRQGLSLRSASLKANTVAAFTCDQAPDQSAADAPVAPAAPDDPDGLAEYLARKGKNQL